MIKIILPTDFSKASLNGVEYALNFALGEIGKLATALPLNIKIENKKCTTNCKSNILILCY